MIILRWLSVGADRVESYPLLLLHCTDADAAAVAAAVADAVSILHLSIIAAEHVCDRNDIYRGATEAADEMCCKIECCACMC